ncbi:ArsR/SmtB family transcription factor [Evansella cellulosilytica]|uniref:Transcriptional regulator, ArsR family n=1 Tax=Evansella cellulosilytica (strain ATCC 21833 / DSM 2522 / FERM P-1141 / JCM 9156 / N-4) TaxID=649639 RepID=E6TV20_EVAC2|nr:metalloregulator ArsR/SmtB family transcription factor [Evansella cellulosilytica]ADU28603.1 transcriptional regulator, ArsR family [Evansella cellulosilytica DSM 2522]
MAKDACDIYCFDEEKVGRLKVEMKEEEITDTSNIFKVLADPTRLKIAYSLTLEEELCVCDIANVIQSSTATASHHLRSLKKQGLARHRKEGKLVFYRLDDDHVKQLIKIAFDHQREGKMEDDETK